MAPIQYLEQPYETKEAPLWFHLRGLSETATGYGRKLRSTRMLRIVGESRWRRIYVVCYSNAGSAYVLIKGKPHYLRSGE
jgi:hypothetical protein